jgi:Protein of unknown function (DUF3995)
LKLRYPASRGRVVAFTGFTGLLKVIAGFLVLSLVTHWGEALPGRPRIWLVWIAGIGMTLYGGLGLLLDSLRVAEIMAVDDEATMRWHLFLWNPVWLIGGLLFAEAGR